MKKLPWHITVQLLGLNAKLKLLLFADTRDFLVAVEAVDLRNSLACLACLDVQEFAFPLLLLLYNELDAASIQYSNTLPDLHSFKLWQATRTTMR